MRIDWSLCVHIDLYAYILISRRIDRSLCVQIDLYNQNLTHSQQTNNTHSFSPHGQHTISEQQFFPILTLHLSVTRIPTPIWTKGPVNILLLQLKGQKIGSYYNTYYYGSLNDVFAPRQILPLSCTLLYGIKLLMGPWWWWWSVVSTTSIRVRILLNPTVKYGLR